MAGIVLEGVAKVYDGGVRAVDDVTLEVADGEFVVLVGPSGRLVFGVAPKYLA